MTRSRAWACLGINQLAFPGLGTIMAGRDAGYAQAAIMVIGFSFFFGFMVGYFWLLSQSIMGETSELAPVAYFQAWHWLLWSGLGLSALAWVWALASSISILRGVSRNR